MRDLSAIAISSATAVVFAAACGPASAPQAAPSTDAQLLIGKWMC